MLDAVLLFLMQAAPAGKPVPRMQARPLPAQQISFERDGRELTRYWFGPQQNRPFLYPANGPSGRPLTRMGHPHDPEGHSHHNSIWISHADVNGANFWADRTPARIVHRRVERIEDAEREAWILTSSDWMEGSATLIHERRRIAARDLDGRDWLLLIDLELTPAAGEIIFGKTPFGLVGVRMARTIGVNDGGGRIRNSEGALNEKEVLWKRARWVDYSGPVAADAGEGITLMDHPRNPNAPTFYHVRNDGWMGASFSFQDPVKTSEPIRLRYGLWVHAGILEPAAIEERWKKFASEPLPPLAATR